MIYDQKRKDFLKIFHSDLLDDAVDFIRDNLDIEDVFTAQQLEQWAEDNGWRSPDAL